MQATNNASRPRAPRRARTRRSANPITSSLTGGTRDVKPEVLSFLCTQSSADATTTVQQTLPIMRNFSSGNGSRAQVIEILKVMFWFDIATEADSTVSAYLSTKSFGTTATTFSEPMVLAAARQQVLITTTGEVVVPQPFVYDCTDGAGNGLLVATDNVFLQVASLTTSSANTCRCKILYRVYGASVTEYVGIVQGQQ